MPFHRCRIPLPQCDALAALPQRGAPNARKVVLMLRNWLYSIEVVQSEENPISVGDIEAKIWDAIHDTNRRQSLGEKAIPIGILTAHDRDSWQKVYPVLRYYYIRKIIFLQ